MRTRVINISHRKVTATKHSNFFYIYINIKSIRKREHEDEIWKFEISVILKNRWRVICHCSVGFVSSFFLYSREFLLFSSSKMRIKQDKASIVRIWISPHSTFLMIQSSEDICLFFSYESIKKCLCICLTCLEVPGEAKTHFYGKQSSWMAGSLHISMYCDVSQLFHILFAQFFQNLSKYYILTVLIRKESNNRD